MPVFIFCLNVCNFKFFSACQYLSKNKTYVQIDGLELERKYNIIITVIPKNRVISLKATRFWRKTKIETPAETVFHWVRIGKRRSHKTWCELKQWNIPLTIKKYKLSWNFGDKFACPASKTLLKNPILTNITSKYPQFTWPTNIGTMKKSILQVFVAFCRFNVHFNAFLLVVYVASEWL
jgi:hypothetical protein